MKRWVFFLFCVLQLFGAVQQPMAGEGSGKVFILPIRDDIMPPLVYLVRRGVKEAMEAKADTLIIDMDTNGGRVDVTQEIIEILSQFKGTTITYVNKKAFSAGAYISFATKKIYMAPQSVIGAAAPITISSSGSPESLPDTVEAKMSSAVSALIRANAEKNGHNVEVADAMVKKTKELKIDGKVLNEKGQILTLTDKEASTEYGTPPKALLSAGTVESMDDLLNQLGQTTAHVTRIEPTGAEKLGTWINSIAPLLLIIGVMAFYIEFKTPGFGLPGIIGIVAFSIYFLGGYIAGLSGAEWIAVFLLGVVLVAVELFAFPGTIALGLTGAALMFVALLMAMVDVYPGMPTLPSLPQMEVSLRNLAIAALGSIVAVIALASLLPKTQMYRALVSKSVSGAQSERRQNEQRSSLLGQVGVTVSALRPGGKAQFGETIIDVISQGDLVPKGEKVKIVNYSAAEAVVEVVS